MNARSRQWIALGCAALALLASSQGADSTLPWKEVHGARIPIPPPEHPRLYLRATHAAELGARLNHPELRPAVERLRAQARTSAQSKVEWDALQYLVSKDRALGRNTIASTLALLKQSELPDRQDACRVTGRMMVTGAMVYDWLYALLTREERQAFIVELVRLAKTQECGYPPKGQGSVTGHASEAMIMRDMVSAGIALYDEFPEIYDWGRRPDFPRTPAGAFQIYHRGALAIDSGLYSGSSGAYGSPHCRNYYWRTVAHNSLLIHDPQEQFSRKGDYGNDGGQRLPNNRSEARTLEALQAPANGYRTGKVLAHGFGPDAHSPDFTLLQGDLTDAYSKKVRQVTRAFVFLNLRHPKVPAALIVFDRVVSADPSFRKYWLLHALEEPQLENTAAVVDCTQYGATGRLFLDVILPRTENLALGKIGGPGREFWVFGTNYANDPEPGRLARGSLEPGAWRVEVSPKVAAAENLFLNVMQVTDRTGGPRWPVTRIETEAHAGCVIAGPDQFWAVLFRRDSTRSSEPARFTLRGPGRICVLATDLTPCPWRARRAGTTASLDVEVPADSGAAWFEVQAGDWTLDR